MHFYQNEGGSKSIPEKNIKSFCGKPLIFWNLQELQNSNVDKVIVATDCKKIKDIVLSFDFSKVEVYDRNKENAQDNSSTESVMLEYIDVEQLNNKDVFMLVQVTSPFTQSSHFNEGLELYKNYDSVLSCCKSKRFYWDENGKSLNYDICNRPRRQDFKGSLVENGAFYINSVENIIKTNNRLYGKIGLYKMPEYTFLEIDELEDWNIAESIMKRNLQRKINLDFSKIKIFLSDVDGVMTDAECTILKMVMSLRNFTL